MSKQKKNQQHAVGSNPMNPVPNFEERIEPSPCLSSLKPLNYPSSGQFLNRDSLLLCPSVIQWPEDKNN